MVDQNLISDLDSDGMGLDAEVAAMFADGDSEGSISTLIEQHHEDFQPGSILTGRIVGRAGDDFVVDVGLKSEGLVGVGEWEDVSSVDVGDEVQVWLETVESDSGHIILSKRKADRILNWHRIVDTKNEGDTVEGRVMRKIKGGLLVDIGYPVFLPASQVDIRRPGDIGEFIGREVKAKILKIDKERRNIVISRRKLIDEERTAAKEALLSGLEKDQVRKGTVKNIADFGAFVDLGGIDGLLHITDMSWDRVGHPSEVVQIDQEIEVKVLNVDRDKEKIALGLKQLRPNPWEEVELTYPPGTKLTGEVVNIMNYGAFVKIEPGVEGLVHISEMSWTRRINHPSEILSIGDVISVIVLEVNKNKQEISLGIKQTQDNPWMHVAEKYPANTRISGRVRNLTNYGAFVEIEEGIDGLLHVSDMSWTKKVNHPSEILKKGEMIDCVVLNVDQERQRIALGLKQLHEDPWAHAVIENYIPGQIVEGTVTKITNFGVFVELEEDLEGLLHVSELADHKVEDPHSEVKIGDKVLVKILRVDPGERKIGLSKKRAEWSVEQDADSGVEKKPKARRGGLEGPGESTTGLIEPPPFVPPKPLEGTPEETGAAEEEGSQAEPVVGNDRKIEGPGEADGVADDQARQGDDEDSNTTGGA
ncbi:MAG: 30S ribosomal protein S1 [Phycisphaerales bacterium]|nr:MAG: 30S ribosomal protein S1 [Phycisphaerales bacterium]